MSRNPRKIALIVTLCAVGITCALLPMQSKTAVAEQTPVEPIEPVPVPVVIVYQPLEGLPEWVASDGEAVAASVTEFESMVAQFSGNPNFRGTLTVTDNPDFGATWPPTDFGSVHIRLRFYDVAYYQNVWEPELDNDWVPGFLDEQEAATTPAVEDALYDLDVWQRVDNETAKIVTLRIGAADGAVSYVTQSLIPCDPIPVPPGGATTSVVHCNAGPWWQLKQTCCRSQETMCRKLAWIVGCFKQNKPWACLARCALTDCGDCVENCDECKVHNPCHSCDPCGLSWIFCRYFGEC